MIKPTRTARDSVGYNNEMWWAICETLNNMQMGGRTRAHFLHEILEDAVVYGLDAIEFKKAIRKKIIEKYGVL